MDSSQPRPGPYREYFDPQVPFMAFHDALTPDAWDVLCAMADDEDFSGASDPNMMSLLFALIRSCRMQRVLQIGTRIGFSTVILASAFHDETSLFLTIEPWEPSMVKARKYVREAGLADRVRFQMGLSLDNETMNEVQRFSPWDLIYVDGNHDFRVVRKELTSYWPLLRESGILALHDSTPEMGSEDSHGEGGVHRALVDWQAATGVNGIFLRPPIWNSCGAFLAVKP